MLKKLSKTKGFTLVELLIVIIIIGILAGMMMLSSGAATDKAEATRIVSDLRNIKAATIMAYADNNAWLGDSEIDLNGTTTEATAITKYLDKKPEAGYVVVKDAAKDKVSAGFKGLTTKPGIAAKLSDMAASVGLRNAPITSADATSADQVITDNVYMAVN